MEAKDTMLSDEAKITAQTDFIKEWGKTSGLMLTFPLGGELREDCLLSAQAEISFKAGYESARGKQSVVETEAYFRGRQNGFAILEANAKQAYLAIIKKVEGKWIIDEDSTHVFEIEGGVLGNGAVQEIEISRITPLHQHPRNPKARWC